MSINQANQFFGFGFCEPCAETHDLPICRPVKSLEDAIGVMNPDRDQIQNLMQATQDNKKGTVCRK